MPQYNGRAGLQLVATLKGASGLSTVDVDFSQLRPLSAFNAPIQQGFTKAFYSGASQTNGPAADMVSNNRSIKLLCIPSPDDSIGIANQSQSDWGLSLPWAGDAAWIAEAVPAPP